MSEEKDLSEQSLNELIEEISAREERIGINPTCAILDVYDDREAARRYPAAIIESVENNRND